MAVAQANYEASRRAAASTAKARRECIARCARVGMSKAEIARMANTSAPRIHEVLRGLGQ